MKPWKKYLIEFVVIVIGILTAIQLENWNQDRKDRAKEKLLLSELHNEFKKNKSQFQNVIRKHSFALYHTQKILNMMPIKINETSLDTLTKSLKNILGGSTFNPSDGTIRSIISSSSIDLISNPELRLLIVSWEDQKSDYIEAENYAMDNLLKELVPYIMTQFGRHTDLSDPRIALNELKSIRFEAMIQTRKIYLNAIIDDSSGERHDIEKTIDDIIRLTKDAE